MFYINRDIKPKSKIENLIERLSSQKTFFYSDKKTYLKVMDLYQKIYDNDSKLISLSERDLNSIWKKIEHYEDLIYTEYKNCFISRKRKSDGSYIDDVIFSKKECIKWIEDNKSTISIINLNKIDEFWDKYPNGVIDFG